ncbi:MAG: hypothetical protein ACM336_05230 [Acidobacteriota bacterium]
MAPFRFLLVLAAAAAVASGQSEASYQPPGEHPSLLLNARRLRLLKRERERQSPRWQQFEALVTGSARLPEPGFALALYYQASGDGAVGRRAVEWAATGTDLRQLALVFDWCQPVMNKTQSAALASRLASALQRAPETSGIPEARSRAFAAIALADRLPKISEAELRRIASAWFPEAAARAPVAPGDLYALLELLHAVRDNLQLDLRDSARVYFHDLPLVDLLSYYPASYSAPENEYRIPAAKGGEPDPQLAARARAADLALVAYDPNAPENQFLQGWLMHDRFAMRGPFGAPYEFLWANPYQPGVSYYAAPLAARDTAFGRLFARSSWDDDASWAGYFDGQLQVFENGGAKTVAQGSGRPVQVGETAIALSGAPSWPVFDKPLKRLFLVGLLPGRTYLIEIDGHEMQEERAGPGGIIGLDFSYEFRGAVRIREAAAAQ